MSSSKETEAIQSKDYLKGEEHESSGDNLLDYFVKQVERFPDKSKKSGTYYNDHFTSYQTIWDAAQSMADRIRPLLEFKQLRSCLPVIAIDINKSPELIASILAVMSLGFSYVPIDSILPKDVVQNILKFVKPVAMIIDSRTPREYYEDDSLWDDIMLMDVVDMLGPDVETAALNAISKPVKLHENDVLAIVFTSGSTGAPKGVAVKHKAMLNRLTWQWNVFQWKDNEVSCLKNYFVYGDFNVELYSAMLALVPLVIVPQCVSSNIEKFVGVLEEYRVTRLVFVPSFLRNLLTYLKLHPERKCLPSLQLIVSNSEILPVNVAEDFIQAFQGKVLANFYGSNENSADVTYEIFQNREYIRNKSLEGKISIGKPVYNTNIYIVDEEMNMLPEGSLGEICVSGVQCTGYFSPDAGITGKEVFLPNPFTDDPNQSVLYKTGDLGKIFDGRLYYYHRQDAQFKVHGHTVVPEEIQQVVMGIEGVSRAEVLCYNSMKDSPVILAVFYTVEESIDVTEEDVVRECNRLLPSYIAPRPVRVDMMPTHPISGKIDKHALRAISETRRGSTTNIHFDLLDAKRIRFLKALASVFDLPEFSIPLSSSFKELGGDSANAIECVAVLRKAGFEVGLDTVLTAGTIAELMDKCLHRRSEPDIHKANFQSQPLRNFERKAEIIDMIAEAFAEKEVLTRTLMNGKPFHPVVASMIELVLKTPSIVVTDTTTGKIAGSEILTDFTEDEEKYWPLRAAEITDLLRHAENEVREVVGSTNLLRHSGMGVDVQLAPAERMQAICFMEEEVLRLARRLGYGGVIGCNVNPVTQQIWEDSLGYMTLFSVKVNEYEQEGKRPLKDVGEDVSLKVMVKFL